jgi:hypothetical protein
MHGRNAKSIALRRLDGRIRACIWNLGEGRRVMLTEAAKLSLQDENQALPTP